MLIYPPINTEELQKNVHNTIKSTITYIIALRYRLRYNKRILQSDWLTSQLLTGSKCSLNPLSANVGYMHMICEGPTLKVLRKTSIYMTQI